MWTTVGWGYWCSEWNGISQPISSDNTHWLMLSWPGTGWKHTLPVSPLPVLDMCFPKRQTCSGLFSDEHQLHKCAEMLNRFMNICFCITTMQCQYTNTIESLAKIVLKCGESFPRNNPKPKQLKYIYIPLLIKYQKLKSTDNRNEYLICFSVFYLNWYNLIFYIHINTLNF
jgi:hypothetical protein